MKFPSSSPTGPNGEAPAAPPACAAMGAAREASIAARIVADRFTCGEEAAPRGRVWSSR